MLSTIEHINVQKIPSYLVSFDIFKAYDKTNIDYLCKVMKHMNFGDGFIKWILLMHKDIHTCFILDKLSNKVELPNCLRQGDNSAMPLFLISIEPLLVKLEKVIKGVTIGRLIQKGTSYVDDTSFFSTDPQDLKRADKVFYDFERLSGTVLHRTKKCKIMGLDRWRGRAKWPLPWLETVKEVKVYGITFGPTVQHTINRSWAECLKGVGDCLLSWSARMLPNLSQRAFLLKVFATSKLW